MNSRLSELRKDDLEIRNPVSMFKEWLEKAEKSEPEDACAMSLASVDNNGMPNVRMVLMRRYDESGFIFFTNFKSQKGEELLANKKAAACFHWKSLQKCVRLRGPVEIIGDQEADDYFFSRPRGSRIGAWASKQSCKLESHSRLEKEVAGFTARFTDSEVPRPDFWSGFRIQPLSIEFWSNGKSRLHERVRYDRETINQSWTTSRLYP